MDKKSKTVQEAIDNLTSVFWSPNEPDSNLEPANIVDALGNLSRSISKLANAINNSTKSVYEERE